MCCWLHRWPQCPQACPTQTSKSEFIQRSSRSLLSTRPPTSKPKTTKMPKITNTVPSKLKGQREEILRIATTGSIATAIQGIKIFLDEQFYMNEFASLQPKLWMCRTLQKIPMSYAPWNISAQSNGIWKASKHQAKLQSLHDLFVTKRFENGTPPCHNKGPQILCRMEFFQGIAVPTQLHKTEIGCHTAVDSDKNKINAHNAKKESAQVVDKLCFAIACMQL